MSYGLACRCSVGLPGPYAQGGGMAGGEGEEKEWGEGEGNQGGGRNNPGGGKKGGGRQAEGGESAYLWSQKAATHKVELIKKISPGTRKAR